MSKRTWRKKRYNETTADENARIKRNHRCSRHAWTKAKKRSTKYFGDCLWLVWGGEHQHRVYFGTSQQCCDCEGQPSAYNQTCCHIQAVKNRISKAIEHLAARKA